jgi:hypothetical protein
MLKVVLTITQTLISIYWAGGMARQNSAIDEVIELVEEGSVDRKGRESELWKG